MRFACDSFWIFHKCISVLKPTSLGCFFFSCLGYISKRKVRTGENSSCNRIFSKCIISDDERQRQRRRRFNIDIEYCAIVHSLFLTNRLRFFPHFDVVYQSQTATHCTIAVCNCTLTGWGIHEIERGCDMFPKRFILFNLIRISIWKRRKREKEKTSISDTL